MKKILKSLAALALVMSTGCVNDLENDLDVSAGKTVVTVGLEATKTYLGDVVEGSRKVYWSEDDQIAINGVASTSISIADGNTFAEFTFDGELNRPFSVLYPASGYVDAQTITLPAVQAAATGTFASGSAPMAGYAGEGDALHLHHLAAVVRLQVKLPAESEHAACTLYGVELRGKSGEQMSGNFSIDYQTATLTPASDEEADKVVTTMVGKPLSSEVVDVFVVVPAREYADGFSVRLIDSKGHYMEVNSKQCALAKGEIMVMPVLEFAPTSTLVGVEIISSAADLVAFAKAYNEGKYAELENLQVSIANDIVFDDATNAEWVPIGTSERYFTGTFDGGNFSIRDWVTSRPLFFGVDTEGTVENLTVDASCILTAKYADENNMYGSFAGYHSGLLSNCHNNAGLTASGAWGTDAYVGALVGSIGAGKIENCSMTGDITADNTFTVTGHAYLGGIAGYIAEITGSVLDSDFAGNITYNGGGSGSGRWAYVGGVVGRSTGTIEGCSSSTDKSICCEYVSGNVARIYLGGIVGEVIEGGNIESCYNHSVVDVKYPRGSAAADRRAFIGGIAGAVSKASVKNCDNANAIKSSSAFKNVYLGGIVGEATEGAVIDLCHNLSTAEVTAQSYGSDLFGARFLYLGGVIGSCGTSSVSNVSNAAKVEMSQVENSQLSMLNVGGCIGELKATLNGNNTIINNGAVIASDSSTERSYLALGGVVGSINAVGADLSYVLNKGNVTDAVTVVHRNAFTGGVVGIVRQSSKVENVTNGVQGDVTKGNVTFINSEAQLHINTAIGGVVGAIGNYAYDNTNKVFVETLCAGKVVNSTNYGTVSRVATTTIQGSSMICGGIVGILKGAGSSIDGCTNNGLVKNEGLNSLKFNAVFNPFDENGSGSVAGGIVGFGLGTSDGVVTISGCTNTAECYALRGYAGGVTGYVRKAEISNSKHLTNEVTGVDWSTYAGGIGGFIASTSVTSCEVTARINGGSRALAGGICGGMDATSIIESSAMNGTVKYTSGIAGAIVAESKEGATVLNCTAQGAFEEKSTADFAASNYVGDGNISPTFSE